MNGAELRLKRITMGTTPALAAQRLGVKRDTLMKWETDRMPIPDDVAEAVNATWENIITKAEISRECLDEIAEKQDQEPDALNLYIYLNTEAHKAANLDMSWEEHTATVGIIMAILDTLGYDYTVIYKK